MPVDYHVRADEKGMVAWERVCERLEKTRNYWIGTARPDGRPHAMPVWGVWLNGAVWFGTDRRSRKARNLAKNPAVVVHLESGDDVVIIEGTARMVTDAAEIDAVNAAYLVKYKMKLTDAPGEPFICAIEPRVVFAWYEASFPDTATRWKF
jgi:PPOX class probable F420-dependent enzyme